MAGARGARAAARGKKRKHGTETAKGKGQVKGTQQEKAVSTSSLRRFFRRYDGTDDNELLIQKSKASPLSILTGKAKYNIRDFQQDEDHWAVKLCATKSFNMGVIFCIIMNVIISVIAKADYADERFNAGTTAFVFYSEAFFLLMFTGELLVRAFAFRNPGYCLIDFWYRFDFFCVSTMYLEAGLDAVGLLYKLLRIPGFGISFGIALRLTTLMRLVRILRGMPAIVSLLLGLQCSLFKGGVSQYIIVSYSITVSSGRGPVSQYHSKF